MSNKAWGCDKALPRPTSVMGILGPGLLSLKPSGSRAPSLFLHQELQLKDIAEQLLLGSQLSDAVQPLTE